MNSFGRGCEALSSFSESKLSLSIGLKSIFKFWFSISIIPESEIRLSVFKKPDKANPVPQSHTCYNTLDLYDYDSKDDLKERLELAIGGQDPDFSNH